MRLRRLLCNNFFAFDIQFNSGKEPIGLDIHDNYNGQDGYDSNNGHNVQDDHNSHNKFFALRQIGKGLISPKDLFGD